MLLLFHLESIGDRSLDDGVSVYRLSWGRLFLDLLEFLLLRLQSLLELMRLQFFFSQLQLLLQDADVLLVFRNLELQLLFVSGQSNLTVLLD